MVSFLWAGILVSSLGLFLHGPIVKERWWFLTLGQKAEFPTSCQEFLHMTGWRWGEAMLLLLLFLFFLADLDAQDLGSSDQQSLTKFVQSLSSNSTSLGFNSSKPVCQWPGVYCTGQRSGNQRIRALNFTGLGLNGSIPDGSIGMLTALKSLDLSNNFLTGGIPADFASLTSLSILLLSNNGFNGSLPSDLAGLTQLKTLDISHNKLESGGTSSAADSLGALQSLRVLNLSNNQFSSNNFPFLANCSTLQALDLSANSINGSFPPQILSCIHLRVLNLSKNSLSGEIPLQVGDLRLLQSLDLSENSFSGQLPPSLGTLRRLLSLSLASNNFSGNITSSVLSLQSLQTAVFSLNRFTGSLPPLPWGQSIQLIDCENNLLGGSIPTGLLGGPSNLTVVRLGNNAITGEIPSSSLNPNLMELDLQSNQLSGDVPVTLSGLQVLRKLDLSSNLLIGSVFGTISSLHALEHLGLAKNSFTQELFPDLSAVANLTYLNLSSCGVLGPISSSVGSLTKMLQLDLSHNDLNGSIPSALSNMTLLLSLDLSWNNLSGNIPDQLGLLTFLNQLNLSHNNLSGSIPNSNQFETFGASSFEDNPFLCGIALNKTCSSSIMPSPSPDHPVRNLKSGIMHPGVDVVIGIVIALFLVFGGFVVKLLCFQTRRTKNLPLVDAWNYRMGPMSFESDPSTWATSVKDPGSIPVVMFEKPLLNLTFSDLLKATLNFHKDAQITEGGCGPVYMGMLSPGDIKIAVKVLFEGGPVNPIERAAQLEALGKVKHPNLVPLVGYSMVNEKRILIYEFMENGNLYHHLHELPEGTANPDDWTLDTWEHPADGETVGNGDGCLSWEARHQIALGVARALAFLHHGCSPHIVHCDVTASNVLLDSELKAHLADCGVAGLVLDSGRRSVTPIIGGTVGYVPPEYGQTWKATTRGDVYSFGVVLLELVTGRRPTGQYFHDSCGGHLVGWVRALIRENVGYKCLDPKLLTTKVEHEMLECLQIGYLCTAEHPSKRPTMQQVIGLLKDVRPSAGTSP